MTNKNLLRYVAYCGLYSQSCATACKKLALKIGSKSKRKEPKRDVVCADIHYPCEN